jgi:hypothetical protein
MPAPAAKVASPRSDVDEVNIGEADEGGRVRLMMLWRRRLRRGVLQFWNKKFSAPTENRKFRIKFKIFKKS